MGSASQRSKRRPKPARSKSHGPLGQAQAIAAPGNAHGNAAINHAATNTTATHNAATQAATHAAMSAAMNAAATGIPFRGPLHAGSAVCALPQLEPGSFAFRPRKDSAALSAQPASPDAACPSEAACETPDRKTDGPVLRALQGGRTLGSQLSAFMTHYLWWCIPLVLAGGAVFGYNFVAPLLVPVMPPGAAAQKAGAEHAGGTVPVSDSASAAVSMPIERMRQALTNELQAAEVQTEAHAGAQTDTAAPTPRSALPPTAMPVPFIDSLPVTEEGAQGGSAMPDRMAGILADDAATGGNPETRRPASLTPPRQAAAPANGCSEGLQALGLCTLQIRPDLAAH